MGEKAGSSLCKPVASNPKFRPPQSSLTCVTLRLQVTLIQGSEPFLQDGGVYSSMDNGRK